MKKRLVILFLLAGVLCLALTGCGASSSGGSDDSGNSDNSGSGNNSNGNNLKTAVPYPTRSMGPYDYFYEATFENKSHYYDYLTSIFGEQTNWPQAAKDTYDDLEMVATSVKVAAREYQVVYDEVFYEYSYWYQPNSTLSITLSSINEVSVSNSIRTSVGITMGQQAIGSMSGSITKETTKTVTTAKGIEVATAYDLTQYDQSKQYKVILQGNYTCVHYEFKSYFGHEIVAEGEAYGVNVFANTLAVRLVHN